MTDHSPGVENGKTSGTTFDIAPNVADGSVVDRLESEMNWTPTRAAALTRLAEFAPLAGQHYRAGRNEDRGVGQHVQVSGLSPYLRHRLLLDQEVVQAVILRHEPNTAAKFIEEVLWRSYFKGWLEHHPGVWTNYINDCARLRKSVADDKLLRAAYSEAIYARTGIAPFDAWVRELRATGYLHNHARMWFASIWIFTLDLPWQLGAQWFHYHLLDGDAASNTLSWRWVAGLHTRGKTYLARADNIKRYTAQRFAGDRGPDSYAGLERLASSAPALTEDPAVTEQHTPNWPEHHTPQPGGRVGLLLHDEDMALHAPIQPVAVGMLAPQRVGRRRASRLVSRFGLQAASSTLTEANQKLQLKNAPALLRTRSATRHWMQETKLDRLMVPYMPIGPSFHRMQWVLNQAAELGIETEVLFRDIDSLAWPHARRGFFALRKHIPDILEQLHLKTPVQTELIPV